jgi:mannose-6-phosphate isomerase-like protein (cupin superfamily)
VCHRLSREETFIGLEGRALARVGDETFEVTPGSALVVPAGAEFTLGNPGEGPFKAVAVLPVGAQARVGSGEAFTPPWAA